VPISGFEEYRPLGRRALWARIALAAMAAVDFMAVFVDLHEYVLFVRLETEDVPLSELEASDTRRIIVGSAQLAALTATAFFFIRWLHHAYRNLRALGAGNLRYATATAVWSWFVPILNLWRPKQVVNDVWRASDPDAPADQSDGAWWGTGVPALLAAWWALWVVLNFAYNADYRIYARAETLDELQFSAAFTAAVDGLSAITALFALAVVRRTTARQEARAARLRSDIVAPPV
jgi:hypothetical protein